MHYLPEDVLAQLIGQPLAIIGRSATMVWCGFGVERQATSMSGKPRTVNEWALHLQCPWTITHSGAKVIDWESMFVDAETGVECDGATRRGTIFDQWAESLGAHSDHLGSAVIGCSRGGSRIYLDLQNGWRFVLEIDPEQGSEQWRLFRAGTEQSHFVAYSSGVEAE